MYHLTTRVAWHDSRWDGTVCRRPTENPYCLALKRVRTNRNDAREEAVAGSSWHDLSERDMPPCLTESGGFMSGKDWVTVFRHPYRASSPDHAHLADTPIKVPAYSVLATPYRWMLTDASRGAALAELGHKQLPPDSPPDFATSWVFSRARQEVLLEEAFRRTRAGQLILLYCKDGHPLADVPGERISRLIVAIGRITTVAEINRYKTTSSKASYPIWDRVVGHSIRREGIDGFLIPYHDYLELKLPDDERHELLRQIAVVPDNGSLVDFSFGAEFITPDSALPVLAGCLESVRRIQKHALVQGPWQQRCDWLNECIADCWTERGAFPGLGAALEAFGLRNATAMLLELTRNNTIKSGEDPWPLVEALLTGRAAPPASEYAADIAQVRSQWKVVENKPERKALLQLLSRFALTPEQAKRWYSPYNRSVSDRQIIENPYLLYELDRGGEQERPISLTTIDRGVLPDERVSGQYPLESPSRLDSPQDARRARAALLRVLRAAADRGDTLLEAHEALARLADLGLTQPIDLGPEWIEANREELGSDVTVLDVPQGPHRPASLAVQLGDLHNSEALLRATLLARARAAAVTLQVDWGAELDASTEPTEPGDQRVQASRAERTNALSHATSCRLGVLIGQAGTGKTTVTATLVTCPDLRSGGVLLLAPTGKARVRLSNAVQNALRLRGASGDSASFKPARTVAQFLTHINRYDVKSQSPLFRDDLPKYHQEKTVVIDEASMLTTVDLAAVLSAFDLAHVQRVILVGDPNQLPPIGPGRPLADLIELIDSDVTGGLAKALGRLEIEMRSTQREPSAALRLASWFMAAPPPPAADGIFSALERGEQLNDLEIRLWSTPDDLRTKLSEQIVKQLQLDGSGDVGGFDRALGLIDGRVDFFNPSGADAFQILSPVRMQAHGVFELNRWIQGTYRAAELRESRSKFGVSLGDEEIVYKDKVIQLRNERRQGYRHTDSATEDQDLANGEIGFAGPKMQRGKTLRIVLSDRPSWTFLYESREFPAGGGPLQLAYALTVHKSQGSDFQTVFFVLPKDCRLASRELMYTALTRSRGHLVLFLQGEDISELVALSEPQNSDTAKRSTNLFKGGLRVSDTTPYAEHLIHRLGTELFRSKSELLIASELQHASIPYKYEQPLDGLVTGGRVWPDFAFETPAGDVAVWEHLGMMTNARYASDWVKKLDWYRANGYQLGGELFVTEEVGGFDLGSIRSVIDAIRGRLAL